VFILKVVKVLCFDTVLQVFILGELDKDKFWGYFGASLSSTSELDGSFGSGGVAI
jgi:hypothetical protein